MEQPLNPNYRRHHPKWYRRRMPIFWWLRRLSYTRFIARELTSVAVAYAALFLLLQVWSLGHGPDAYARFIGWIRSPALTVLNVVALAALLFHSVTWLNLAPKALVVRVRGVPVPPAVVAVAHYGAWLAASAVIAWLLLGGS